MLAAGIITASVIAPPARGAMMAVALGDEPAHRLLSEPGVRLRGIGTIPNSIIIDTKQGGLWMVAIRHKILLLNGSARLCSEGNRL